MDALRSFLFLLLFAALHADFSSAQKNDNAKSEAHDIDPYVLSGEVAPPTRFPYMCSLRARGTRAHGCGGFLVDQQWVVTAAHCVDPDLDYSLGLQPLVYCGTNRLDDDDEKNIFVPVDSRIHEKWNGDVSNGYDIAMLKLGRNASLVLPDLVFTLQRVKYGQSLIALGWGRNENGELENFLQVASDLLFIPNDQCNKAWKGLDKDRQMCAGLAFSDTCKGDSGGPLILPDALDHDVDKGSPSIDLIVGVTSFGSTNCSGSKPGVYTNLGYFKDWIQNVIDGKPQEEPVPENVIASPIYPPTPAPDFSDELEAVPSSVVEEDYLADFIEDFSELNEEGLLEVMKKAIESDRAMIARNILEEGLDPDSRISGSSSNDSLLHWAAQSDSPQCAKATQSYFLLAILLDNEADIEKQNNGYYWTPLHKASREGQLGVAKFLVDAGANIEARSNNNWTPLHLASRYGHTKIVKILVAAGADIEAKETDNWTPLHLASRYGHTEIVKILVAAGADTEVKSTYNLTPLHWASTNDHTEVVEILIDAGADIEAKNDENATSLHLASRYGHTKIVEILIDAGADIEAKETDNWTPLHMASAYGFTEIVKILIAAGAYIEAKEANNWTPLHLASSAGHTKIVEILVDAGAYIEAKEVDNWTPLHLASRNGHTKIVEILVDAGAYIEAKDVDNWTPLHLASRNGYTEIVKILVENDADIDAETNMGSSPLHLGAFEGHVQVVEILLENGANKETKDDDGDTPFDLICQAKNASCTYDSKKELKQLLG